MRLDAARCSKRLAANERFLSKEGTPDAGISNEATYDHGLLRIEVPFKDPMEDAVKVAVKAGGAAPKTKKITTEKRLEKGRKE